MLPSLFTTASAVVLVTALCASCGGYNPPPKQTAAQLGQVMALQRAAHLFHQTHGRWPNTLSEMTQADRPDDVLPVRLDPRAFRHVDLLPKPDGDLLVRFETAGGITGNTTLSGATDGAGLMRATTQPRLAEDLPRAGKVTDAGCMVSSIAAESPPIAACPSRE